MGKTTTRSGATPGFFRVDIRPGSQAWAAGPVRTDANGIARLAPEQQMALSEMGIVMRPVPEPPPVELTDEQKLAAKLREFADRLNAAAAEEAASFMRAEAAIDKERKAAAARLNVKPPAWRTLLGHPKTLADAEAAYRDRAKSEHPDAGGHDEAMRALNEAIATARSHFK